MKSEISNKLSNVCVFKQHYLIREVSLKKNILMD